MEVSHCQVYLNVIVTDNKSRLTALKVYGSALVSDMRPEQSWSSEQTSTRTSNISLQYNNIIGISWSTNINQHFD